MAGCVIHMKAVLFNCSPRVEGNTFRMLNIVAKELESAGIQTEIIQVGGKELKGCKACGACRNKKNMECAHGAFDGLNNMFMKMVNADAIIIGSPTYFADLTSEAKSLIDRCGYVARGNGNPLRRKIGAAVVSVRRAGAIHVFDSINHFFTINEMIVPGSSYWNIGIGLEPGDVEKDAEGVKTMKDLGANVAWLMKKLK